MGMSAVRAGRQRGAGHVLAYRRSQVLSELPFVLSPALSAFPASMLLMCSCAHVHMC